MSYLRHVKEPLTKGHLSCRDTFPWILKCPLMTGFTVCKYIVGGFSHGLLHLENITYNAGDSAHLNMHALSMMSPEVTQSI